MDALAQGIQSLAVNTKGNEVFNGAVGKAAALASLTTDDSSAPGSDQTGGSAIFNMNAAAVGTNRGGVNTTGAVLINDAVTFNVANSTSATNPGVLSGLAGGTGTQTYNGAATLQLNTVLADQNSNNITFNSTVDALAQGIQSLAVNTKGNEVFNGLVGSTTALASLTTDASTAPVTDQQGGSVQFNFNLSASPANTATVKTTGSQTYNDAVISGAGIGIYFNSINLSGVGAGHITAINSGNDFKESVQANAGGDITLYSSNILTFGGGAAYAGAGLGTSTAGDSLFARAAGAITVNAALTANGVTPLKSGLELKSGGLLTLNASVTASTDMILDSVTFNQTAGTVTATDLGMRGMAVPGSVGGTGPSTIAYNGGNFTWNQGAVTIWGAAVSTVAATGAGIPLTTPSLAMAADAVAGITTTGNLSLTATTGNITQVLPPIPIPYVSSFANVNVTGTTTLQAAGSIILNNGPAAPVYTSTTFNPVVRSLPDSAQSVVGGGLGVGPGGNDFHGLLSAKAGTDITLNAHNGLSLGNGNLPDGLNAPGTTTLTTGHDSTTGYAITQTASGAVNTGTLIITAGGTVDLSQVSGGVGINQVANLGAVPVPGPVKDAVIVTVGDFVLFNNHPVGGLNLNGLISALAGGVKVVTNGGMTVTTAPLVVTANAPLSAAYNNIPNADQKNFGTILVADHVDTSNFTNTSGSPITFSGGTRTIIYVQSQSASSLLSFAPGGVSPNTYYNDTLNIQGNPSSNQILAVGESVFHLTDSVGSTNVNNLPNLIQQLTNPVSDLEVISRVDKGSLLKLRASLSGFKQAHKTAGSGIGTYGPFQFLGYDYEDLINAGYGTPKFDPSKLDPSTTTSILDGLLLKGN